MLNVATDISYCGLKSVAYKFVTVPPLNHP